MTREEQIQKLIDEENGIDNYGSSDYQVGVLDGARLADKNPNSKTINAYKEKQLIEKACEWLREQKEMIGISFQEDFIERFKLKMKKYTN